MYALVELSALLGSDVIRVSGPDRLCLAQLFLIDVRLLDLPLLLVPVLFFLLLFSASVFYLRLVIRLLFFFLPLYLFVFLLFCLIITNFFITFLLRKKSDGTANELRVLLRNLLYSLFLQVWSSFRCRITFAPRPIASPVSVLTVKDPPAEESQAYCSSSLCLVITVTFSATKYAE